MSLMKEEADKIAAVLKSEFNNVAAISVVKALNTDYRILVDQSGKPATDVALRSIEARANVLAGRTLTRQEIEFKTGLIYF